MSSTQSATGPLHVTKQDSQVSSRDGTLLHITRWQAPNQHANLLIVHGYSEYGQRYRELAHALAEYGISSTAVDLRGHGKSQGQRGHVMNFDEYLEDIDAAFATLPTDQPIFILGHSNGGLAVLSYVTSRKPKIAGTIVTNPFLGLALKAPAIKLWFGKMAGRLAPKLSIANDLTGTNLTRDPVKRDEYLTDREIFHVVNTRWFTEATARQDEMNALTSFPSPLLFIYSNTDPVASPTASQALAEKIGTKIIRREGELHEILNEIKRTEVYQSIGTWIQQAIAI